MSKQEANAPVSLPTMLGSGKMFEAQGKKYKVLPFKLKEVDEFAKDNLIIGDEQFFNLSSKKNRENLDKWLRRKILTENDEPLTVEKAMEDDWDLDDLKLCIRTLMRISG